MKLVLEHRGENRFTVALHRDGKSGRFEQPALAGRVLRAHHTETDCEVGGQAHADCYRFAVKHGVVIRTFNGVTVCVSVIQNGAERTFALIAGYDIRFQLTAAADHPRGERIVARADFRNVRFQRAEESFIKNRGSLDDLRESAEKLIVRKRLEKIRINDNRLRLMKRSDKILAFGDIHARFAADG